MYFYLRLKATDAYIQEPGKQLGEWMTEDGKGLGVYCWVPKEAVIQESEIVERVTNALRKRGWELRRATDQTRP